MFALSGAFFLLFLLVPFPLSPSEVFAKELQAAAANPNDPQSSTTVSHILNEALNSKQKIDPAVVSNAGVSFLYSAGIDNNQQAWISALQVMNYRSAAIIPTGRTVKPAYAPPGGRTSYLIGDRVPGKPLPQLQNIPNPVAPEDEAHFEALGKNLNANLSWGSPELILKGGAINIDGKFVEHVVFEGVEVHYTGQPLKLRDVVFDHCTFEFNNTSSSRELAKVMLSVSRVDFETK